MEAAISVPRRPPVVSGAAPFVGHGVQFWRDPYELLQRGLDEHGRAFTLKFGPKPTVVLLGPAYNKWFFDNTDKLLSFNEGYPFIGQMFAEDMYFMACPEEYRAQRAVVQPRFQGAQLDAYVRTMALEVRALLNRLGDDATFDLLDEIGPLVMHIAARAFLGDAFRERLGTEFFWIFRDFSLGLDPILPPWLPTPSHLKAGRAKRKLHRWLQGLIEERRARPMHPPDFLQTLIESTYPDGAPFADDKLINLILVLVWAGHETTAGHAAWGIVDVLQNPEHGAAMVDELDAAFADGAPITRDLTKRLGHVERGLKESERLHPVTPILMRGAKETLEVDGLTIPEGHLVAVSPHMSQRLPDLFDDPDRFDPGRFDKRQGGLPPRNSVIGFGGGIHRCAGVKFAYIEMTVILAMLFREYDVELLDADPRPVSGFGTKWPEGPLRLRIRRRPGVPRVAIEDAPDTAAAARAAGCPFHAAK